MNKLHRKKVVGRCCFPKWPHVTQKLNKRGCLCQQTFYRNKLPKKYSSHLRQSEIRLGNHIRRNCTRLCTESTHGKMKYGSGTTYNEIVLVCVPNRLCATFVTNEWDSLPMSSCLPTTYLPLTNHLPTTYLPTTYLPTTYQPLFLRCSLFTITVLQTDLPITV